MDGSDDKSKFDQMIYELLEQNEVLSSDELESLKKQWAQHGSLTSTESFGTEDSHIIKSICLAEYLYVQKNIDLDLLREGLENELKSGQRLAEFVELHLIRNTPGNASSKSFEPGQILSARIVGRQKDGYTIVELSTKMHGFLATDSNHKIGDELKVHFAGWDQGTLLVTEKFFAEAQEENDEAASNVIPFRRPSDPDEV